MSHLGERIAEFALGEMTAAETVEAKAHLNQCPECSGQVAEFRRMHAMLRAVPDADLPRPVVFEFEKPVRTSLLWRWFPPLASAAAASILTAVLVAPAPPSQPSEQPALVQMQSELDAVRAYAASLEKLQERAQSDLLRVQGAVGQLLAQRTPTGD